MEAIDRRKEEIAAKHQELVAPMQQELAAVEAEQLERVRKKRDSDPQLDERRKELLQQIREATANLERDIQDEDRLRSQFAQEAFELNRKAALRYEHEGELRLTARHDLQIALEVAQQMTNRAFAFRDHCRNRLSESPSEFWAACLASAEKDLAAKQAESSAAFAAVMSE